MNDNLRSALIDLKNRGANLNLHGNSKQLGKFKDPLGISVGSDFHQLYSMFNGFSEQDHKSQINLWNLEKIIDYKSAHENPIEGYCIIGDILIESDYIVAKIFSQIADVRLLHEKRVLASSLKEFVIDLALGKHDII
jgi:hypothetical protein